jgi:RNase H-fold protein (predicted Holliday junction resolvase)
MRDWVWSDDVAGSEIKFHLPYHFDQLYKQWQQKYAEEIVLTLPLMSAKERTEIQAIEKRIRELEKQLELAQMKIVAANTVIDIAEKDYKLEIRKKYGPKQ